MESPTNGELALMIQAQGREAMEAHAVLATALTRVETKIDQTNGRVRKLEAWKYAMMGALALLNLIAVPLVVQWLGRLIH